MAGISDADKAWINSFLGKETDEEFKEKIDAATKQLKIAFNSLVGQGFSNIEALTILIAMINKPDGAQHE